MLRFEPLFYHKSFDRFVPWEQREKTMVFSCTMGCSAHNLTAKEAEPAGYREGGRHPERGSCRRWIDKKSLYPHPQEDPEWVSLINSQRLLGI